MKFTKSHFEIRDNIVDKKLNYLVNEKGFTSKKNVRILIDEILASFAMNFTDSDINLARRKLT